MICLVGLPQKKGSVGLLLSVVIHDIVAKDALNSYDYVKLK